MESGKCLQIILYFEFLAFIRNGTTDKTCVFLIMTKNVKFCTAGAFGGNRSKNLPKSRIGEPCIAAAQTLKKRSEKITKNKKHIILHYGGYHLPYWIRNIVLERCPNATILVYDIIIYSSLTAKIIKSRALKEAPYVHPYGQFISNLKRSNY